MGAEIDQSQAASVLSDITQGTPMENRPFGGPSIAEARNAEEAHTIMQQVAAGQENAPIDPDEYLNTPPTEQPPEPQAQEQQEAQPQPQEQAKPEGEIYKGLQLPDGTQVDVPVEQLAQRYHEHAILEKQNQMYEGFRREEAEDFNQRFAEYSERLTAHMKEVAILKQTIGVGQAPDASKLDPDDPESVAAFKQQQQDFNRYQEAAKKIEEQIKNLSSSSGQQNALNTRKLQDIAVKLPKIFPEIMTKEGYAKVNAWLLEHGITDGYTSRFDIPGVWTLLNKAWRWDMAHGMGHKESKGKSKVALGRQAAGHQLQATARPGQVPRTLDGDPVNPVLQRQMSYASGGTFKQGGLTPESMRGVEQAIADGTTAPDQII